MTVREKMDQILNSDPDYVDNGEYHIDGRDHGILQSTSSTRIKVVYESKDDIDNAGNPLVVEIEYDNLGELLSDYPLTY
jgi:hypothetical protein